MWSQITFKFNVHTMPFVQPEVFPGELFATVPGNIYGGVQKKYKKVVSERMKNYICTRLHKLLLGLFRQGGQLSFSIGIRPAHSG